MIRSKNRRICLFRTEISDITIQDIDQNCKDSREKKIGMVAMACLVFVSLEQLLFDGGDGDLSYLSRLQNKLKNQGTLHLTSFFWIVMY